MESSCVCVCVMCVFFKLYPPISTHQLPSHPVSHCPNLGHTYTQIKRFMVRIRQFSSRVVNASNLQHVLGGGGTGTAPQVRLRSEFQHMYTRAPPHVLVCKQKNHVCMCLLLCSAVLYDLRCPRAFAGCGTRELRCSRASIS